MNPNLDPDLPENQIIPYSQPSENRPIPLSKIKKSESELIGQALAERIGQAETHQEVEKLVKLLPYIDKQKESQIKQSFASAQIEEYKKQADFNRKIAERKEFTKIVASITGVGAGLYLMPTAPLFAPLLIILGLASPLQYSLREVANLWDSIVNSTKNAASDLLSPEQPESIDSGRIDAQD